MLKNLIIKIKIKLLACAFSSRFARITTTIGAIILFLWYMETWHAEEMDLFFRTVLGSPAMANMIHEVVIKRGVLLLVGFLFGIK